MDAMHMADVYMNYLISYLSLDPATILNLTVSPSPYTELGASVNLSCQASGYPVPTLYWSKQSHKHGVGNWLSVRGEVTGHIPNKTTSETSLIINDIQREDIGRYRCTASNDLNTSDEMEMELYLEGTYGMVQLRIYKLIAIISIKLSGIITLRRISTHADCSLSKVDYGTNGKEADPGKKGRTDGGGVKSLLKKGIKRENKTC